MPFQIRIIQPPLRATAQPPAPNPTKLRYRCPLDGQTFHDHRAILSHQADGHFWNLTIDYVKDHIADVFVAYADVELLTVFPHPPEPAHLPLRFSPPPKNDAYYSPYGHAIIKTHEVIIHERS